MLKVITGNSVSDVLYQWKHLFVTNEISQPKESIECIMVKALNIPEVSELYEKEDSVLTPEIIEKIGSMCNQRLKKYPMPIPYILGQWKFCGLTLKMSPPVFIPEIQTEMLVDMALKEIDLRKIDRVLEPCCGTGAVSLALLKARPHLRVVAVDKSEHAYNLTKENAARNNLSDRLTLIHLKLKDDDQSDAAVGGKYDLIVSNPPYNTTSDLQKLTPETKLFEDLGALDGGDDGMDVMMPVMKIASRLLNPGGKMFLEVNYAHPVLMRFWFKYDKSMGLKFVRAIPDMYGKERFVELVKV